MAKRRRLSFSFELLSERKCHGSVLSNEHFSDSPYCYHGDVLCGAIYEKSFTMASIFIIVKRVE